MWEKWVGNGDINGKVGKNGGKLGKIRKENGEKRGKMWKK